MLVKGGALGDEVRKLAEARWDDTDPPTGPDETLSDRLLRLSHEVIFEERADDPIFHLVSWSLDPELFELVLVRNWEVGGLDGREAMMFLARAIMYDIAVYPNEPKDEAGLIELQRSLIETGIEDATGKRYKLTRYGRIGEAAEIIETVGGTESLSTGEAMLLRRILEQRAAEHIEAAKVLIGLRTGIDELRQLLDEDDVSEAALQGCLTRNPLLFGAQYREVRPKHSLGSEYEMDYALVRLGGFVDLVEIEKASDVVYTKRGNPSAQLTHAEQQVLDWLAWIDEYGGYAERNLPELERPIGYVVIGRAEALDERTRKKLARRNAAFKGSLEIMTFDALVDRAEAILAALTGAGAS
jgi:hypothetical protein